MASIIYAFHTLISKSSQASFKPNFISNMPNYIEINQVNHLTKFFSIESDGLKITQNCLDLDNKKQVFLKF